VIPKHGRGWGIEGLIRYLMGPGRFNEHVEQRVIASWDKDPAALQPESRVASAPGACGFDVRDLVGRLNAAAVLGGVSMKKPAPNAKGKVAAGPVWHCSLRNHEQDRVLTDAEWTEVVEDVMHRTGIAPRGDVGACRWVAIRHADDHVHIAAMLVRQDTGKKVSPYNDWPRTLEATDAAEVRYGLTRTAPADRTAVGKATRAEVEKAVRRELGETPRTFLRRAARVAAVRAHDEASFYEAMSDLGVLVAWRRTKAGELLGYALAQPGDVNAAGAPVWFAGSTLARDLSLIKLRARWAATPRMTAIPPAPQERRRVGQAEVDTAVAEAVTAIEQATNTLAATTRTATSSVEGTETLTSGPASTTADLTAASSDSDVPAGELAAGIVHAVEDMLIAVSETTAPLTASPAPRGGPADIYQRAARQPRVGQPTEWGPVATELRTAACRLLAVGKLAGRPGSAAAGAALVLALASLIAEVAAYHDTRRQLAQASAAHTAHRLVRERRPPGHPRQPSGPTGSGPDPRRPDAARTRTTQESPARHTGAQQTPIRGPAPVLGVPHTRPPRPGRRR
jgi:hypothetical protein